MSRTRTIGTAPAAAPSDTAVNLLVERLKRDPNLVIAKVVERYYWMVLERYNQVTGEGGNPGRASLTRKVQALRQRDPLAALFCITVPWELEGNNSTMDVVTVTLKSEMGARMTDASNPTLRMSPYYGPGGAPDFSGVPNVTAPNSNVPPDATGNTFWNSLPGILTAAGGLVGAFTGNLLPGGGSTNQPPPAAPRKGPSLSTVLVVGVLIIVTIAGAVYLFRKK